MTAEQTQERDELRACRQCQPMRSWNVSWYENGESCPACGAPGEIPPPLVPAADEPPVPPVRGIEVDIRAKAYDLLVLERAREVVRAKIAGDVELPWVHRLDSFLSDPDDDVTHRVAGLWPSGGRVVLSAANKAGKTTMVGNLLRSLVDGESFLDQFEVEPVGRVVLVDNELDENMLRRWLREQGIVNTSAVWVLPLRGQLSTFDVLNPAVRSQLAGLLGSADVLVFDCLRPALDALGLSEDKDAGRFLEALDELTYEAGIAETLVVHHMGHSQERSRGDSRILDWPDAVWKLVRDAEDDEDEQAPSRRYFTAYGRDVEQAEALLSFEPTTRRLSVAGGSRQDTRADRLIQAVCEYLADHPGSSKNAIEKAVEGRAVDVRKALTKAVQQGVVEVERVGSAHLHTLTPRPLVPPRPDERTTPSSRPRPLVYRTRDEDEVPGDEPTPDLVRDEPACRTCGQVPSDRAGLGSTGRCVACEMEGDR